jgi:hypothetical protein
MNYAIDPALYFESTKIKPPINQGSTISSGDKKFTVDHWFGVRDDQDMHSFVFIPLPGTNVKPFGRKPSEVAEAIRNNTITVELLWPSLPQNTKRS